MHSETSTPSVYTRPVTHRFRDITARVAAGENRHRLVIELIRAKRASMPRSTRGTEKQLRYAHMHSYAV
jgi:hypothetical protein